MLQFISKLRWLFVLVFAVVTVISFQNCGQQFSTEFGSEELSSVGATLQAPFVKMTTYGPPLVKGGRVHLYLAKTHNKCAPHEVCPFASDEEVNNILSACSTVTAATGMITCAVQTPGIPLYGNNILYVAPCNSAGNTSDSSLGFVTSSTQGPNNSEATYREALIRSCFSDPATRQRQTVILLMRILGVGESYRKTSYMNYVDLIPGRSSRVDSQFDIGGSADLNSIGNLFTSLYSSQAVQASDSQISYMIKSTLVEEGARHLSRSFADGSRAARQHLSTSDAQKLRGLYGSFGDHAASCMESGVTISHGASEGFYFSQTPANGEGCRHEFRVCSNGSLSGSAKETKCHLRCRIAGGKELMLGTKKTLYRDGICSQAVSFDCNLQEVEKLNSQLTETCAASTPTPTPSVTPTPTPTPTPTATPTASPSPSPSPSPSVTPSPSPSPTVSPSPSPSPSPTSTPTTQGALCGPFDSRAQCEVREVCPNSMSVKVEHKVLDTRVEIQAIIIPIPILSVTTGLSNIKLRNLSSEYRLTRWDPLTFRCDLKTASWSMEGNGYCGVTRTLPWSDPRCVFDGGGN